MAHRNGNRLKTADQSSALVPFGSSAGVMTQIRDEFDRWFDRFFHGWPGMNLMRDQGWNTGLQIKDEDDSVLVRAEMPGVEADDIDVQVNDNRLVLRAEHKAKSGDDKSGRVWQEREYYQAVSLPAAIDPDKIDAQYHNGVLTLKLPKTEQSKNRRVKVRKD